MMNSTTLSKDEVYYVTFFGKSWDNLGYFFLFCGCTWILEKHSHSSCFNETKSMRPDLRMESYLAKGWNTSRCRIHILQPFKWREQKIWGCCGFYNWTLATTFVIFHHTAWSMRVAIKTYYIFNKLGRRSFLLFALNNQVNWSVN